MSTVNLTKTTINLSKGDKINLSKTTEKLKNVMVGLGWDPVGSSSQQVVVKEPGFFARLFGKKSTLEVVTNYIKSDYDIDCDAWLAMLGEEGGRKKRIELVYYNNLRSSNGAVVHHGDNLTGEGDGDDEEITIDMSSIPSNVTELVVGVTIYSAKSRGQSFGLINNTFIRIVDASDGFEICRYEQKDFSSNGDDINFIAGRFVRSGSDWEFEAIGTSNKADNIQDAIRKYIG